jgi:hypothetical protein
MASTNGASNEKSYFEQQRELLVGDVAASLEAVLQNIRTLVLQFHRIRIADLCTTGWQ